MAPGLPNSTVPSWEILPAFFRLLRRSLYASLPLWVLCSHPSQEELMQSPVLLKHDRPICSTRAHTFAAMVADVSGLQSRLERMTSDENVCLA